MTFKNTGTEPFVSLRYFGPDVHPNLPEVGVRPQGWFSESAECLLGRRTASGRLTSIRESDKRG